jgi:hypothetical protein
MPAAQYPDATNVYLAAGVKEFLTAHGLATPVLSTGKIPTPRQAEAILQDGQADLIGLARPLLADPDWPRKARLRRDDQIIRCVYGNVCKSLDERFRTVRCVLWPKDTLHAPEAPRDDDEAPTWPAGSRLEAELKEGGQVRLSWDAATDPQGMYGYDVLRRVNGGPQVRLSSGTVRSLVDAHAFAGNTYAYAVRAYDFAGNRSEPLEEVSVEVPVAYGPDGSPPALGGLDGDVEAKLGYHA